MIEEHLILCSRTEGHKDIVLVVLQVIIGRRHDVARHLEGEVTHRKLKGTIFLLVERIGEHMTSVPFVTLRTIGSITIPEEVWVERCHGSSCQSKAYAVDKVLRQVGVDRSEVKLASLTARATTYLHIVLHQCLHT